MLLWFRLTVNKKSWSFSSDSQELENPSQKSNFSDTSDLVVKKELLKIKHSNKIDKLESIQKIFENMPPTSISNVLDINVKFKYISQFSIF